ncbi:hypothetical protein R3P38DRAFT_3123265 [Favolaschia claudopus]|uniref:NAD(P)-binding protein n=1 Tax=Favolaschia claudopus TaxID=2862362 RepID=A0AAV9ZBE5_9AGAR
MPPEPTIMNRLKAQTCKQPPVVEANLTGKTVVVLGGSPFLLYSEIRLMIPGSKAQTPVSDCESCKHFAKMNAGKIILACRSESRGRAAVDKLRQETGYTKGELWIVDLADFRSVISFVDKYEREGGRLDILLANAAMEPGKFVPTKDGWESTMQVNYLATSLVVLLLLPTMERTARECGTRPRVVSVSSELIYDVGFEPEAVAQRGIVKTLADPEYLKKGARMRQQYSITKLLNLSFTRSLTTHLPHTSPLIAVAPAPGFCVSELRRDLTGAFKHVAKLMETLIALPTEVGARRLVAGAVGYAGREDELKGQFMNRAEVGGRVEERIWVETLELLGKVDSRVKAVAERYLSG